MTQRLNLSGARVAARVLSPLFATIALVASATSGAVASTPVSPHAHLNCMSNARMCAEVYDSEKVFGEDVYVGHDEPSNLFYSNVPGSGANNQWRIVLPTDPSPSNPHMRGKSYNFELHPAFWLGMAMCDTQSFPEQLSTCAPASDSNIVDPAISPNHPGEAFTELQFYPPGWVSWPPGVSCDPTKWCAALAIFSLSINAVTNEALNDTCANLVGFEPGNFAFITLSGSPQPGSPPNPVNATNDTFTPNSVADLFMNQGDEIVVTMHDTPNGLETIIEDLTSGQTGSMTASAANGFGQVEFRPHGSQCNNIPYDFHPMYSTSSEKTRVTWAAHSYNVAFSDEIGHFDMCTRINHNGGKCTGKEGILGDREPADGDDHVCFRGGQSLLVQVTGCLDSNGGFDGLSYLPLWPDGNTTLRPTPIMFTSPKTGASFTTAYSRSAFEADLPRVENNPPCDRFTGSGCTLIPSTDDLGPTGQPLPAIFYPFFSTRMVSGQCWWQLGDHIPGSKNDFGQNAQWGSLLNVTYTDTGGGPTTRYNDFRNVLSHNPC